MRTRKSSDNQSRCFILLITEPEICSLDLLFGGIAEVVEKVNKLGVDKRLCSLSAKTLLINVIRLFR